MRQRVVRMLLPEIMKDGETAFTILCQVTDCSLFDYDSRNYSAN